MFPKINIYKHVQEFSTGLQISFFLLKEDFENKITILIGQNKNMAQYHMTSPSVSGTMH